MRRLLTLTSLLMTMPTYGTFGGEQGVGGSAFHKNDITYSTDVKTPHVKWVRKLPGGSIKGFFIPSVQYGRDMVELMQRLDLDPTTVSIDRNWDINCWGIGDYYGHETRGDRDDFQIVYRYVERDLTGPKSFDVMVIPGLNGWSRMTRPTRDAILKRVANGAGLVLIHPFVGDVKNHPFKGDEDEGDIRIWEISPLVGCPDDRVNNRGYPEINQAAVSKGKWEAARTHFITAGQSLKLLPEGEMGGPFYTYTANGDVLIKSGEYPILAVKKYGKGRVVAFAYVEEGFIPQAIDPVSTGIYWNYWEYYYSLLSRAILWAAGRDSSVDIKSLAAQADERAVVKITLSTATVRNVEIEVAGRSEFGQFLGSYLTQKSLSAGENVITVPGELLRPRFGWPGGRQIFNVIIREADTGRTLNWGASFFDTPRKARLTQIQPASDVFRRGEVLNAVLSGTGDISNLSMRFRITDDLERLLTSQTTPAITEKTFSYQLDDFLGKYAFITAELVDTHRRLIDVLLAHLNLRGAAEVFSAGGQRLAQAQMVRYSLADSQVVAIVKENIGLEGITGKDGVTTYDDSQLGKIAKQDVTLRFPERFYVYDVRSGQQFGNTRVVKTSITVGGALILGLSRTQKFVTVSGPSSASRGDHVRFDIKLSPPGKHLLRCHFFAPDGSFMPVYQSNLSLDGPTGAIVLPSALNDPAGQYRLRVSDAVTGATAEARVRLQ